MRAPTPLRKLDRKSRKLLLAELDNLGRREPPPHQRMIERFLQCPKSQAASANLARLTQRESTSPERFQTPGALLPWLH